MSERQREGETSRSLQAFLLFVKNSQPLTVDLLVGEERAVVGRREHEYLFLLLWKEGKTHGGLELSNRHFALGAPANDHVLISKFK